MVQNQNVSEPGQGWVLWWLDRLVVTLIASLIFICKLPFFRLQVAGRNNIPTQGRVLIFANHSSYPGIFLGVYSFLWPWVLRYMAMLIIVVGKQKYLKHLGPIRSLLRHLRVIELPDKGKAGAAAVRREVIRRQVEVLTRFRNAILWVYGEGTRTDADKILNPFLTGVGRLVAEAVRTGADFKIMLFWDQGSQESWYKGQWPRLPLTWRFPFWRRFRVTYSISRPIAAQDHTTTLYQLCQGDDIQLTSERVAAYLRSLLWAFAVEKHPELAQFESPDLDLVAGDLWRL
ncbi:MAG: lysophospholipid acyltransferase family protein [Patescibacteria group bacterium]|jgi:1-acyl-sn-glycerol-3-phosphate acyltransferase